MSEPVRDARLLAPDVQPPATAADDMRVGALLGSRLGSGERPRCVIVGFPTDVGVRRNGGRAGAAKAPRAIREMLYRLTPGGDEGDALAELLARTRDLGDLETTDDLDEDQQVLARLIAPHVERDTFVIVLGGGHETAYGLFLAQARATLPVRILNWDAHTDVRPVLPEGGHSGSPFRQALEHVGVAGVATYTAAGLQPHAVARAHADWIDARKGRCVWRHELSVEAIGPLYAREAPTMVTFDLDAVDQAHAPGVSAPSTGGLSVAEWLAAAEAAGKTPSVRSCDVVELAPPLDRDGQTARLAAVTVWRILRGLARRG